MEIVKNRKNKQNKSIKNNGGNNSSNKHHFKLVQAVKLSKSNRILMFITAAKNHLSSFTTVKALKPAMESLKRTNPEIFTMVRKFFRTMTNEILGTWEPEHWFRLGTVSTVVGSTGIITTVLGINFQGCSLADEFEAIFDEVQVVGPFHVEFRSYVTSTTHEYAIGVIDYDNNTVLASIEGALAYDTAKIFVLNPYYVGDESIVHWTGHIQGGPDDNWISIASVSSVAYWKAYSYANVSGSTIYGTLSYRLLCRLRQMVGAV
jgi:hypothetical protein